MRINPVPLPDWAYVVGVIVILIAILIVLGSARGKSDFGSDTSTAGRISAVVFLVVCLVIGTLWWRS